MTLTQDAGSVGRPEGDVKVWVGWWCNFSGGGVDLHISAPGHEKYLLVLNTEEAKRLAQMLLGDATPGDYAAASE
jgi:hypothetical protein